MDLAQLLHSGNMAREKNDCMSSFAHLPISGSSWKAGVSYFTFG